jgi:hypothetical protein
MHHASTSIYVCMFLDRGGRPIGAQVIQAANLDAAAERAEEMLGCHSLPARATGYELWHRGQRVATHFVAAAA